MRLAILDDHKAISIFNEAVAILEQSGIKRDWFFESKVDVISCDAINCIWPELLEESICSILWVNAPLNEFERECKDSQYIYNLCRLATYCLGFIIESNSEKKQLLKEELAYIYQETIEKEQKLRIEQSIRARKERPSDNKKIAEQWFLKEKDPEKITAATLHAALFSMDIKDVSERTAGRWLSEFKKKLL